MKTIWKFILPLRGQISLALPQGALILSVQNQREQVCLWVVVDPRAPFEPRHFEIVGTGQRITDPERLRFIGTVQTHVGDFVWHVFEVHPVEGRAA